MKIRLAKIVNPLILGKKIVNKGLCFFVKEEKLTFNSSSQLSQFTNMKMNFHHIILSSFLVVLSSCSSIEVFNENNELPLVKPYQTFVIINKEVGMRGFSSQFIDELVQIQIQETLENSGMIYDSKQPDVVIRYHSNEDLRQREVVNNLNPYPFWGYRVYNPWIFNPYQGNRVSTSNYELLQVIVDFIDPVQDKFLMTLTGVTEVSSPKQKQKRVEKTLDSVLRSFVSQNNQTRN